MDVAHIKDFISITVPFLSGGFGCYIGVKVSLAILRIEVDLMKEDVKEAKEKLQNQVGDVRCFRNREECKKTVHSRIDENAHDIETMRTWVTSKFEKIANFMGRINGNGPP
jgi:hypothetical protein